MRLNAAADPGETGRKGKAMKLDTSFVRELRKINGDGTRDAKFAFLRPAQSTAKEMSNPDVINNFGNIVKEHGRTAAAVCVAATAIERADRLNPETVEWAREVIKLWTNRPADLGTVLIADGLHPTRIEQYAGALINATIAE